MPKSIHRPEYTVLCALLREKRLAAGLQQTEVSARLKRRQPFVSDVERGVRRLDLIELQDLAAVYEVDLIELIQEYLQRTAGQAGTRAKKRAKQSVR